MKVSLLCFDLAANAVGRAHLLAQLLEPMAEVEIVGPRYGPDVWAPIATGGVRHVARPGRRLPGFLASVPGLLRLADGDLIYCSKPRLTSAGIGYLKRLFTRRPLLLDIDDWEVGFFLRGGFWGTAGRALNLGNPTGLPWTWLMERLTGVAHGITVASRFLQQRFGGVLIPHVRDTEAWRPGCADPAEVRRHLRAQDKRVVMFLGTPRDYKGVDDLYQAVERVGRSDLVLALVGTDPLSAIGRAWDAHPNVRVIGKIPFAAVPRYLSAADIVAVPQRATSDTRGQVPAKLFDAMALGRPIVSTRVSMIPEVLDGCGVLVEPGDVPALAAALARLLDDPSEAERLGRLARERCEERYSFHAARRLLFPLVKGVMAPR